MTLFLSVGVSAHAAKPKSEKQFVTTVFDTNITCENCKKKIMNTIPFENGIKDVVVDVQTKQVTITYDAAKNSDEALIEAFAKIKVKAQKAQKN